MTILWRPAMAIGDDMVDTDHQHLVDLINTVELTLRASAGEASLSGALDALSAYTKEHFEREETLMRVIGYGRLAEHRDAHHKLRSRLVEMRRHIEEAKATVAPPQDVQKLVELLRSWLLDHVIKKTCCSSRHWRASAERRPRPPSAGRRHSPCRVRRFRDRKISTPRTAGQRAARHFAA
ncbi:MAG: hemerythrin family protein [Rubrivivax sp.]|nr:hemerythrin family protein [Rubrivivax sp.]